MRTLRLIIYRIPEDGSDWYPQFALDLKEGLASCSQDSITWADIEPQLMRRMFHLLYTCRAAK